MANLAVTIAGIQMKNPVMVASGTFGYGKQVSEFYDLSTLGAIVVKTTTLKKREGNPPSRICETPAGMLNTIGLQNPGIEHFLNVQIPFLSKFNIPIILNIGGEMPGEFAELCHIVDREPAIAGIELNISCPNVQEGGMELACNPAATQEVVRQARRATQKPLIVKLSPNVTSITQIARVAVDAGADALSLINTILGMSIDIWTRKTKISRGVGGLSGPAIRPIAVRMVWEVAQAVHVPVIGMGGIMTAEDAIEFFLAGASAVAIGTANFVEPFAVPNAIKGIEKYLDDMKIAHIQDIVGKVVIPEPRQLASVYG